MLIAGYIAKLLLQKAFSKDHIIIIFLCTSLDLHVNS